MGGRNRRLLKDFRVPTEFKTTLGYKNKHSERYKYIVRKDLKDILFSETAICRVINKITCMLKSIKPVLFPNVCFLGVYFYLVISEGKGLMESAPNS